MTEIEIPPAKKTETDVDTDDDVDLCFRAKRRSTAKTVDDDCFVVKAPESKEKKSKLMSKIDQWFEECEKLPPLYGDEKGEVDISSAAVVDVDGPALKEIDLNEYYLVIDFADKCRQKCWLKLFHHPGDPRIDGLGTLNGDSLKGKYRDLAVIAIKEYQKVNQKVKLKLRDLMKINFSMSGCMIYYMTFSAENELNGKIKTYQAALLEYSGRHLLGLLRNLVDDEILAILSVKGMEEDLPSPEFESFEDEGVEEDLPSSEYGFF